MIRGYNYRDILSHYSNSNIFTKRGVIPLQLAGTIVSVSTFSNKSLYTVQYSIHTVLIQVDMALNYVHSMHIIWQDVGIRTFDHCSKADRANQ